MSLIEDILDRYLYKEDVAQLAVERGFPRSWNKPEHIHALLTSGRFAPADAVAYLNVRDLRRLCREWHLSPEGDRDALVETVLAAIWEEINSAPPRKRSAPRRNLTRPSDVASPPLKVDVAGPRKEESMEILANPPTPAPSESGSTSELSRIHPDSTGPWTVVGIIATVGVGAFALWSVSYLGFLWGGVVAVIVAAFLAGALLLSSHKWVPTLARVVRRVPE